MSDIPVQQDGSIHPTAVIHDNAEIGEGVIIHPFVVIGEGVSIGRNCEIFPGTVIGKAPRGPMAREPQFKKSVSIGENCFIGPNATVYYEVDIGNDTLVGDGASVREKVRIGKRCIIARQVTINYNTTIGDRTRIMDGSHITGNCAIGEDVFISVLVGTTNDNAMGAHGYHGGSVIGPIIRSGARIGAGAMLLPGVVIGFRATVATGAVVTKDVKDDSRVFGVPAKEKYKYMGIPNDEHMP